MAKIAKNRCARPGKLSTQSRNKLPDKAFGLPSLRAYPMYRVGRDGALVPSRSHAANAKARASAELKKGYLTKTQYDRIVRKADKVLAQCSKSSKASDQAQARRINAALKGV